MRPVVTVVVFVTAITVVACGGVETAVAPDLAGPETDLKALIKPDFDFVPILGGTFKYGCDPSPVPFPLPLPEDETVDSFKLMRTRVTVDMYAACVAAGECTIPRGPKPASVMCNWGKPNKGNHPINCITWGQAGDLCQWAGGRLPTSAEWEYEAKGGSENRKYPWGNEAPDSTRAYFGAPRDAGTVAVGLYPAGASRNGILDMDGDVWTWIEEDFPWMPGAKEIRGADWYHDAVMMNSCTRYGSAAGEYSEEGIGVCCAQGG